MKLGEQSFINKQLQSSWGPGAGWLELSLPNVTLVCIDDLEPEKALEMMQRVGLGIKFADIKFFTSSTTLKHDYVVSIPPITSIKDYDEFVFKDLVNFISTDFCMFVQLDGQPLRNEAWRKEFLDYDYIGAPWTWVSILSDPRETFEHCPTGRCVGNSGFSIRSKKLMEVLTDYEYDRDENGPEDEYVCRTLGEELKSKGIKFAPVELASMFSAENTMYRGEFGFHGRSTYEINRKLGLFK